MSRFADAVRCVADLARPLKSTAAWRLALAIGVAAGLGFLALSWASLAVPKETISARIIDDNGVTMLGFRSSEALGHRGLPRLSGNDCLILSMLLLPYPGVLEEVVSPRMPTLTPLIAGRTPDGLQWTCTAAVDQAAGAFGAEPDGVVYYHRYVAGFRPLLRILVGAFPLPVGVLVPLGVNLALLGGLLIAAGWHAVRAAEAAVRTRHGMFAIVAGVFLVGYGLPVFGMWPSYAFADTIIFGFLIAAWSWPLCRLPEARFIALAATFGALTAGFEFLTGGTPLGLALVLGCVALGDAEDSPTLQRRAVLGAMAFATAALACFLAHYAAVLAVFGPGVLDNVVGGLANRVGSGFLGEIGPSELARTAEMGIDLTVVEKSRLLTLLYLIAKLAYMSRVLAWGSVPFGVGMIAAAVVVLVWKLAWPAPLVDRREAAGRLVLVASALTVPVWYVVFLNHSVLHALWMVRPLVWLPALACALLVKRLAWRASSWPEGTPLFGWHR